MFFFVASLKIIKKLISKILRTLQSFFSYNFLFKFSCNFERSDPIWFVLRVATLKKKMIMNIRK